MKNIFAHTDAGTSSPAFISVNVNEEKQHSITVRSQGNDGKNIAKIDLTPELLESLVVALASYLKGEKP